MARASLYDFKKDGILEAIKRLTDSDPKGRPPSLRQVADVTDTPVATLHAYVTRLRSEGLVEWSERHHRSLRLVSLPPGSILSGPVQTP